MTNNVSSTGQCRPIKPNTISSKTKHIVILHENSKRLIPYVSVWPEKNGGTRGYVFVKKPNILKGSNLSTRCAKKRSNE